MLPHEIDVKWLPVPIQFWRGIPLGYNVILTAHSAGGVELRKNEVFSITRQVPPTSTSYKFTNLMSFYKYSVQVSAFTKVADGPKSELAYVGKILIYFTDEKLRLTSMFHDGFVHVFHNQSPDNVFQKSF